MTMGYSFDEIAKRANAVVPAPDVHIPLTGNAIMTQGFGQAYQLDVSAAQDGSVMVDLPMVTIGGSRSSKATCINKSNQLMEAGINEPRFEKQGFLREGSSTNLIYQDDISQWTPRGGNSLTSTSEKLLNKPVAETLAHSGGIEKSIPITERVTSFTFSVFVKGNRGGQAKAEMWPYWGSSQSFTQEFVLTGQWQRIYVTATNLNTDSGGDSVQVRFNSPDSTSLRAACPQLEGQSRHSSFIPCDGTATTRNADSFYFLVNNNLPSRFESYTIAATYHLTKSGAILTRMYNNSGSSFMQIWISSNGSVSFSHHGGQSTSMRSDTMTGTAVGVFDADTMTVTSYRSGYDSASKVINPPDPASNLGGTVAIGYYPWGVDKSSEGHLKDIRIWHQALTPAQAHSL